MKMLLLRWVSLCLPCLPIAQFASDLPWQGFQAGGVAVPFYSGSEATPSMMMRVDRVYTDHERRGFFRIGVLPLGVMDGVSFEVLHPETFTNSLAQAHRCIGADAAARVELRRVVFRPFPGSTDRLEVRRVRPADDGRWELLDGVDWFSGTNHIHAPRALLQTIGPSAGRIVLATRPSSTNFLFARPTDANPQNKETP